MKWDEELSNLWASYNRLCVDALVDGVTTTERKSIEREKDTLRARAEMMERGVVLYPDPSMTDRLTFKTAPTIKVDALADVSQVVDHTIKGMVYYIPAPSVAVALVALLDAEIPFNVVSEPAAALMEG